MRLFEIANDIEMVLSREVDRATGEITDETLDKLAALELSRDEKALGVAAYLKGERAEGEAVKLQADALYNRALRHERRAAKLLEYLDRYLPTGAKLRSDVAEITWRKSTRVEIDDAAIVYVTAADLDLVPDDSAVFFNRLDDVLPTFQMRLF